MRDTSINSGSDTSAAVFGRNGAASDVLMRIAGGDKTAVNECIALYGGLVWSMSRRQTSSTDQAEDAACRIFLDIWRCAKNFETSKLDERAFVAILARLCLARNGWPT